MPTSWRTTPWPTGRVAALLRRGFRLDDVLGYKPDVTIDRPTELVIGGTRFTLLPTRGGETDDALLMHMPDHGVLFVGDILMPYFGAPFIAEGSVDGLLAAIDQVMRSSRGCCCMATSR